MSNEQPSSGAFSAPLFSTRQDGGIHVITFSRPYQIRQLAEIVGETVGDCELAFAQGAGTDKRNYRVNCDKALRFLRGFQPQWTARADATELHEAHGKYGLTLAEFEGPKFQRIAHIRQLLADGILDETLRHTTTAGSPS